MLIDLVRLQHAPMRNMGAHWFSLICAGRAAEGLRAEWQRQLRKVQEELRFSHIRFHGLFHDEMMVCRRGDDGSLHYNFRYIDQLFDFLLEIGLKPFVELGFMPSALAKDETTLFWWKVRVSPPQRLEEWEDLVRQFFLHCIHRYGMEEVRSWYVEIWNEPCIVGEFWSGTQKEYFDLYATSARCIKAIDPAIKVGGPSSAFFTDGKAPWMEEFLDHVVAHHIPIDFVTAHPYPVWWDAGEFSESALIHYRGPDATADDLRALKTLLKEKGLGQLEVHVTEWNSSFLCRDVVHDTAFKGPFILSNCLATEDLADSLGYWTFTDLFEEHGAGNSLFHGGFGLMTENGLKKPAYWGYWFLRKLGAELIEVSDGYAVARKDKGFSILLWNEVPYREGYACTVGAQPEDPYSAFAQKESIEVVIRHTHTVQSKCITTYSVTREKESVYDAWVRLGSPEYPDKEQVEMLEQSCRPHIEVFTTKERESTIELAPFQMILWEITEDTYEYDHHPMAKNI